MNLRCSNFELRKGNMSMYHRKASKYKVYENNYVHV